jgi:hypothetical protein
MNINTIYAYDDMKSENCVISEWRQDTDLDDYMEMSFGKLHYNLINELLILLNKNKSNYEEIIDIIKNNNELKLNEFIKLCNKEKKDIKECLLIHLNNILFLSDVIRNSITFTNFIKDIIVSNLKNKKPLIEIQNKDLYLYRGFNNNSSSSKIFDIIDKENRIITPVFLSTTIIKTVAKRFLDKRQETSIQNKIMWKIIVPYDRLNEFNYIYFGENINIDSYTNQCGEFEFLLNIGAILQFQSKEEIIDDDYNDPVTRIPRTLISYTLYTYNFEGWNKETLGTDIFNLKQMINNLIENFTTSSKSPKTRKTKKIKSSSPTSAKRSKK